MSTKPRFDQGKEGEINYSKHLTPDDWGDPHENEPTRLGMLLVLLIPVIFFIAGISFEWWVQWGH